MTIRNATLFVWATLAMLLPLPFFLVETGSVPLVRMFMFAGVTAAVLLTEGSGGVVAIVFAILFAEILAYAAALLGLSYAIVRVAGGSSSARRAAIAASILVAGLVIAGTFDIYETPFRRDARHSNLFHLFD